MRVQGDMLWPGVDPGQGTEGTAQGEAAAGGFDLAVLLASLIAAPQPPTPTLPMTLAAGDTSAPVAVSDEQWDDLSWQVADRVRLDRALQAAWPQAAPPDVPAVPVLSPVPTGMVNPAPQPTPLPVPSSTTPPSATLPTHDNSRTLSPTLSVDIPAASHRPDTPAAESEPVGEKPAEVIAMPVLRPTVPATATPAPAVPAPMAAPTAPSAQTPLVEGPGVGPATAPRVSEWSLPTVAVSTDTAPAVSPPAPPPPSSLPPAAVPHREGTPVTDGATSADQSRHTPPPVGDDTPPTTPATIATPWVLRSPARRDDEGPAVATRRGSPSTPTWTATVMASASTAPAYTLPAPTTPTSAPGWIDVPTTDQGQPAMDALVETMRWQRSLGGGTMQLRLRPEHFGEVTVTVQVQQGHVTATLMADSPATVEYLQQESASLRDMLQDRGLVLDRFEIKERDSHSQRDQQQPPREPPRRRGAPTGPHEVFEVVV